MKLPSRPWQITAFLFGLWGIFSFWGGYKASIETARQENFEIIERLSTKVRYLKQQEKFTKEYFEEICTKN